MFRAGSIEPRGTLGFNQGSSGSVDADLVADLVGRVVNTVVVVAKAIVSFLDVYENKEKGRGAYWSASQIQTFSK